MTGSGLVLLGVAFLYADTDTEPSTIPVRGGEGEADDGEGDVRRPTLVTCS